ncbi:hypothetical protein U1Q18_051868 [Sarracenia purpurea var. burkii]
MWNTRFVVRAVAASSFEYMAAAQTENFEETSMSPTVKPDLPEKSTHRWQMQRNTGIDQYFSYRRCVHISLQPAEKRFQSTKRVGQFVVRRFNYSSHYVLTGK